MLSSAAHPLIGIDLEVRFGRPCIVGTHISVRDVLGCLSNSMSVAEISKEFPELTTVRVEAARAYAADHRTPYIEVFGREADFQVTYRLFTAEEGGRRTPAHQGIRWDSRYDEATRPQSWMVYPEFIDPDGFPIPNGPFAPVGRANMFALNPNWLSSNRQFISLGTRGYFMEGSTRMGVWEVSKVRGLRYES
jgi:uncharacterized protein (DUF433 family)